MGTIGFLNVGLIAVAIAEPISPGDSGGFPVMAMVRIVGALLGGLLVRISSDADRSTRSSISPPTLRAIGQGMRRRRGF